MVRGCGRTRPEALVDLGEDASWWYHDGRLYWVFLHSITSGAGQTTQQLGLLAVGYQVDSAVAQQLAAVAGNQIALTVGETVIASTLPRRDEADLERRIRSGDIAANVPPCKVALEGMSMHFLPVLLRGSSTSPVHCYVDDAACAPELVDCALEPYDLFCMRIGCTF